MSIEIKSDILAKELNQGIVPLGVPKAYQYDAALVEAARAAVNQGIDDVAEAGATAVTSVKAQEYTSTTNINTLGDKILAQMKHGYGYPFTAATAAAMTDTAKIYVYTGSETGYNNGNWYYYNGSAWVSGGVYNSTAFDTDKTLTVSGAAADAQKTGMVKNTSDCAANSAGLVFYTKYITVNGDVHQSPPNDRYLSGFIDCIPNATCKYIAETNHTNILGISFYDEFFNFISGVSNAGTKGVEQSTTVPSNAYYCRLSTDKTILANTYVTFTPDASWDGKTSTKKSANIAELLKRNYISSMVLSSNFDVEKLNIDNDGYIFLKEDLDNVHTNYVWLYENIHGFKSAKVLCKLENDNSSCRVCLKGNGLVNFLVVEVANSEITATYYNMASGVPVIVPSANDYNTLDYTSGEHTVRLVSTGLSLFLYVDNVLLKRYKSFANKIPTISDIGLAFRGTPSTGHNSFYKNMTIKCGEPFAHISFDDQLACLKNLTENADTYTSLFENNYFKILKDVHDKYGSKFTLELFYQDNATSPTFTLADVTTKFRQEFANNATWLKFAYHGPDSTTFPANSMTTDALVESVEDVYSEISRFATKSNIDKVPRLTFFNCTKEQALALKEAELVAGFLSADDSRSVNVGLDANMSSLAESVDYYVDFVNGITYFRSDKRYDIADVSTDEQVLENLSSSNSDGDNNRAYIIFAHSFNGAMGTRLEVVAKWISEHNIAYDYPMNHLLYDANK